MSETEVVFHKSVSIRPLPANFNKTDINLFEHELRREIPAAFLRHLSNVTVYPEGLLFSGTKILEESFPTPEFAASWLGIKVRAKALLKYTFKERRTISANSIWVTDTLSHNYFHWITDVLPRLFAIRDKLRKTTLLLPSSYRSKSYVASSLKPFFLEEIEFIDKVTFCPNLMIPTRTAPTGNYNESAITGVRKLYINSCKESSVVNNFEKIYISRGKAQKRALSNEVACIAVLEEFEFKTIYFEDYSFEQQVEMISNTKYLVSNHGSGLTNMLFMKSEGRVLELRQKGDSLNNCFFALASAFELKYFYQLCDSQNLGEDANAANLVVDCRLLRENIERMLGDANKQL